MMKFHQIGRIRGNMFFESFEQISYVISSVFLHIPHNIPNGHMSWTSILFTACYSIYIVPTNTIYPSPMVMPFFCAEDEKTKVFSWCDRMMYLFILLILSFSRIAFLGCLSVEAAVSNCQYFFAEAIQTEGKPRYIYEKLVWDLVSSDI